MCSASRGDLTARARIRDAAIECFGQQGFGVSVRAIAEHAGVSPGLVIHHFGSKEKLREACDSHVRQLIMDSKSAELANSSVLFLQQLAELDDYGPALGYLMRSLQTGGTLASEMFEQMVEEIQRYLATGEQAGTITPSRDPVARARYATSSALGSLLLHTILNHPGPNPDHALVLREWIDLYMLPALEAYTEPILAHSTYLDAFITHRGGDPTETPRPDNGTDHDD